MTNKENNEGLFVTPAPHIYYKDSVPKIMWIVFISLLPAAVWGVYFFGLPALKTILACIIVSLLTEIFFNIIRRGPITISDGSAAVTGILLSFTLPPYVPLYVPIAASIFAVGIAKQLFGGLGYNFMNPALAGRVFVMFSWVGPMTENKYFIPLLEESFFYNKPEEILSAISSATPLNLLKSITKTGTVPDLPGAADLFIGKIGGSIGEVSALFLLLGGFWLLKRKYITWHIPVTFIGTTVFLTFIYALIKNIAIVSDYGLIKNSLLYAYLHCLSGGLLLGAIYMATDMVTTPITIWGQYIVGFGCGLLTFLIRVFGGYPEGVMFAIILMQLVSPLIDRVSKPRIYGWSNTNGKN